MARTRTPTDSTLWRKEPERRVLTSDRIANDLAKFESAGGHIEVLGITRVLTKLDGTADASADVAPARTRGRGTRK